MQRSEIWYFYLNDFLCVSVFSYCFLQSHDCLRHGPPVVGNSIVVVTPDDQILKATFVKQHANKVFQVREALFLHLQVTVTF